MRVILFLVYCCLLAGLWSCAQSLPLAGYAYQKPVSIGKERRDLDGNPVAQAPDTLYLVYLETRTATAPRVTSVTGAGRTFTASVYPVGESPVHVGATTSDEPVVLKKTAGRWWWRIELSPAPAVPATPPATLAGFHVEGVLGKKPFSFTTRPLVLLRPDIRP